ncbi:hypothetical protein Hanom_Chr15g01394551 [Helianthus anomalus]
MSTSQQPKLQTTFLSNTDPFGRPFDPTAYLLPPKPDEPSGPLTDPYGRPFDPKDYLSFSQAAPQQTQPQQSSFDPKAYFPFTQAAQ